ncbi:hypothetical protein LTS08_000336 [Lithohypha guttulata]|nr:hypothetical protein LTS08_000336 [Lithohypha guttulata]
MAYPVRFHEAKRWRSNCRTDAEMGVLGQTSYTHADERRPRFKYSIPVENPSLVKPGHLYIHRYGKAKEFVRNREKEVKVEVMCSRCARRCNGQRDTKFGQAEAALDARIAQLKAELEEAEEREQRERIGFRQPRRYHYGKRQGESATPPPKIIDAEPQKRRGSFVRPEGVEHRDHACNCHHHKQHHHKARRPPIHNHHVHYEDRRPDYSIPHSDHYRHYVYSPTSDCHSRRRPSYPRVVWHHEYNEDIPLLFQRIFLSGRRRKSSIPGCRRTHIVEYPYARYESRAPEDYYY